MRARTHRTWIAAAIVVAALGAGQAPASAKSTLDSFDGSCSVQGDVKFSPPATNSQQSLSAIYDSAGTCSGTLNGRTISDMPVTMHNAAYEVDGSCLRADTTKPGRAAIAFADGTIIRLTSEFHFVATNGTFSFHGERSGSGSGTGSFLTQRTPPDISLQCAGDGVSEAPLDVSLSTDDPVVSKRRSGAKGARSASRTSTFSGSCAISGHVSFDPPLTNTPHAVSQRVRATGTCDGTFVDRRGRTHQLSDAPVTFSETSQGDNASCNAGTATGRASLRFKYGKIRGDFSETRAGGTAIASTTGDAGGSAQGVANVSQSEDPSAILQKCGSSGLERVAIDAQLATTPSISG